jgi:hypothetical protein
MDFFIWSNYGLRLEPKRVLMFSKPLSLFLTILLPLCISATAFSSDENGQDNIPTLEQVTVVGEREAPLTVSETLSREKLDLLPKKNGSINEALGVLPGVQLGEFHRTSDNAGEILPPNLSISGGRIYENNFMTDGFSNNSLLDPTFDNIDNKNNVPGHPQQNFLHPSLVENVTVYRSNVPARYGNFTGGAVDIETRDPSGSFGGEANIRHTRSEWTDFHKSRDREEEYDNPIAGGVQPEFDKYDGSILLDVPISENTGILASYNQIYSKIPYYQIEVPENTISKQDEYRRIENFFLKSVTHFSADTKLSITGTYAPYEADYFREEVVNSDYTLENSAYSLMSNLEHRTDSSLIEVGLGYSRSTNSREAHNLYQTWQVTESKSWGEVTDAGKKFQYSKEGGYGDIEKEQDSLLANVHVTLDPIGSGTVQHNLSYGFSYERVNGTFDRTEEFTNYTLARKNDDVICEVGAVDCINNEQFMFIKTVYPEDEADITIKFYDTYFEDRIEIGQLTLRPGVRISSENFQDNTNLAPRLAAGYDLFGDGKTNFYAGFNRYYGKTLMTYALEEQKTPYTNWRRSTKLVDDKPQEWRERSRTSIAAKQVSDLETPYSDEITVGVTHSLFGGILDINYLERDGEDQLASTLLEKDPDTGYVYTEWNNDGESTHQSASVSWEKSWRKHYLFLGATWQETETNNSDYYEYTEKVDERYDGFFDPVWYRNSLVDRSDLPRPDFNREVVGNLVYSVSLPLGMTFTNSTRYRSGYEALENTGDDMDLPSGESYDIYEEVKQPESWIFDWTLKWEKIFRNAQAIAIRADLNNVFNQKVLAGNSDDTYELGRQFWLGMTYNF